MNRMTSGIARAARLTQFLPFILPVLVLIALGSCASPGTYLKWEQVDAAALMRSEAGQQAYNTVRFATFGPKAEQLFGYFLYRDGVEVRTEEGIPFVKLGKMTLREVFADYEKIEKANMYTAGSSLNVQQYRLRGSVVGYTAADINIDVSIWDITEGEGPTVLRVVYKDLRQEREQQREMQTPRRGMY